MLGKWGAHLPVVLIVLFSLFLFRDYFIRGLVPFPANLLVSYYEPWKSYPVPEYPNGPPNKPMGFDNVRIFYPVKKVVLDSLKQGQFPLWNPHNFAGNPVLGSYQSAVFHPLSWLFFLTNQIDAWSIMTILQPIFSALAMYVFLRVLGLSLPAQLIGALTFAFSGFFMTWWQESYMYTYSGLTLPLALAAVELYIKKPKNIWLVLLAISLALSISAGMPQITFYVYAFAAVWVLYRWWGQKKRWHELFWLIAAFGLSMLIAAVQLLPAIESYALSTRISTDVKYIFDAFLLPPYQLVTLLAPDYFGNPATYNYFGKGFYHDRLIWFGAVPLVLMLTQLLRKRPPFAHGRFFQIAFVITLSLTLSIPTTWIILYHLKLPLLSTITPSRIMVLVTFTAAVLAAYGAQELDRGLSKKLLLWITVSVATALVTASAVPFWWHYLDDQDTRWVVTLRNLAIPTASFVATFIVLWTMAKKSKLRSIGYTCLVLIMLGNSFLFAKKYVYFSERRFVFPQVAVFDALKKRSPYARFWTYENGYIEKNFASYYGLFSPEGYDAYMIRRYGEFHAYANSHGTSLEPDRSNALIQSTDHMSDILTDPYRIKTVQLLGVRYILRKLAPDKNEQKMSPDPRDLPRVWEDGTYAINEYATALPRAYLYSDIRVESNPLPKLFDPTTDMKRTVFLEESAPFSPGAQGKAEIVSYTPNKVVISTETDGDMVLFLSDTYYPGWKAYVDGKESKVYRANYTFRAVGIPKGTHHVEFRYEPLSWKLGVLGSLIGVVLAIILMKFGAVAKR